MIASNRANEGKLYVVIRNPKKKYIFIKMLIFVLTNCLIVYILWTVSENGSECIDKHKDCPKFPGWGVCGAYSYNGINVEENCAKSCGYCGGN